jgi:C-terminal processing protease CtpA/Prc
LYKKPVILLTSSRTFSAAEDFAAAFKALHIGVIIGEATGGSSGQPLSFILPGNGTARVCTKRDQFPDGEDFIGKGIQPDIIIKSTVADCRKRSDTQLEAALRALRK